MQITDNSASFNYDLSKDHLPPALILGLGNHGLALVRSLGRSGIHAEAADSDPEQFQSRSRYCAACHRVRSLDDESLVSFLVRFGKKKNSKWVLFITRDKTVPVISSKRYLLEKYFYFNLPDNETIDMLMNKYSLAHFLDANACVSPRTLRIENKSDIRLVSKKIGYPCIIKPVLRTYGFKASKALSEKELLQAYAEASKHTDNLIVQDWAEGPDTEIYFCFVYTDSKGEFKGTFVGKKIRKFPNQTGIASAMQGCCNEFVLKETRRLFQLADYRGFGSAEFKRDKITGDYKFIEFSVGRTDYNVETAIANGVDLPFIGYCNMTGIKLTPENPIQSEHMRWVDFTRDLKAIRQEYLRGEYSLAGMIKNILENFGAKTVHAFFAPDDLKPFLVYMADRMLAVFRKIRRLYRGFR